MKKWNPLIFIFLLFVSFTPKEPATTTLIFNIWLIDGTGAPARKASVRIRDNKIIEVGDLKFVSGEMLVDGKGKVLAPGFIDSHSHIGGSLKTYPEALACVNQGVTTIVGGQDGEGWLIDTIKADIQQHPIAINMAVYTGHTMLREMVMHSALNRPATEAETEMMGKILEKEIQKGSLGLSTGLEYEGAFFSSRKEVLQMAKVTASQKGRYISHIRSEDITEADALDEIITIGREASEEDGS
jgi:N-acyl-D-aspartate/D-glutamate deacylase